MSDVIYEEKYEDILPCYYVGMFMNILLSSVLGIIFCVREVIVGKVDIIYVFTGYCGYIALVLVFYSMLYLSICKDYKKISFFFAAGMTVTFFLSLLLVKIFHWSITYGMLFSLAVGFWLIACMEMSVVRSYFRENSGKYREVLGYFREYWPLVVTNFLYTLGLYIHNFVFWTTDLHMIVVKSFVCVTTYDMATCLAMFLCKCYLYQQSGNVFSRQIQGIFRGSYRRKRSGYRHYEKKDVPYSFRRADEPCQSPVYYYAGDLSDLYDHSSSARFRRDDPENLSVSGSRIFYSVSHVCRDYFYVLF